MKKSLVALAALAATAAFAQSSVTITGIMDANYQSLDFFGQKVNQVGQSGARTSTFKFIGTEDLGGGMSANFQFEVQPAFIASDANASLLGGNTKTGAGGASGVTYGQAANPSGLVGKGESFVGLKDNTYGEIKAGTVNTNTFKAFAAISQMGTGIGSGYDTGMVIPSVTRLESSAAYYTPTWNGLSAGLQKGYGNDAKFGTTTTQYQVRNTVTDYGLNYDNGPLALKYANRNEQAYTTGVITTSRLFGGAYDAGVAKFTLGTGNIKTDNALTDATINIAAVSVPFMGSYRFIAQQGSVKYTKGAPAGSAQDGNKNKIMGLALEKDLSKRTFVYLRSENVTLGAADLTAIYANGALLTSQAAGGNTKRTNTAIGISHQF